MKLTDVRATSATTIDPAVTTIVTNPTLGVTLDVPPGSAISADGITPFTGQLTISSIPSTHSGTMLPTETLPCELYTVQPAGVRTVARASTMTSGTFDISRPPRRCRRRHPLPGTTVFS